MNRCLQLAAQSAGNVAPNPMVGAVLVYENRIIGEGYHMKYGEAHAEVNCVNSVKESDRELIEYATMYVSLEPCAHYGKTPPCADLIIEHKIPEVVIACQDPFERVNGSGIEKLKKAGISVIVGVLEKEAIELNKRFYTFHLSKRPYIILKWAQSLDQKIAALNFSAVKISNDITNKLVHKWRSEEAAIMVGFNTARFDDPSLTNRLWDGQNPLRIVLDPQLELTSSLKLFSDGSATVVINRYREGEEGSIIYRKIEEEAPLLPAAMAVLHHLNLTSVLIEGGAKLLQSFINEGVWDEARIISNESLQIGEGVSAPVLVTNIKPETFNILSDQINIFRNHR